MARNASADLIAREVFLASLIEGGRHLGSALRRLAREMDDVTLAAGESLYRIGERSEHFYFVESGEIELSRVGAVSIKFVERELLGTLDATLQRPHTHDAVATKPTHLLRLRIEDWSELLEDDFEMARRAVTRVAGQVYGLRLRPPPLGGFDEPGKGPSIALHGLQVVDRILRLREVAAFRRASTQALAELARLGSTMMGKKDDVMFAAGEMKGQLVVIASGEVSEWWKEADVKARFGPSSLVGGTGSISNRDNGEVRVTVEMRAIVLPLEDYFDVMEEHFDVAQSALIAMAEERESLLDRGR
jgi:CRP-like cAMP-binding protein